MNTKPPLVSKDEINASVHLKRMYQIREHPKKTTQGFDFFMNLGAHNG